MNPQLLQPLHRQRRGKRRDQHIRLRKRLKDMFRHRLSRIPFQRLLNHILLHKRATRLLPSQMRLLVVWRRKPNNVRRLRKGDKRSGGHGAGLIGGEIQAESWVVNVNDRLSPVCMLVALRRLQTTRAYALGERGESGVASDEPRFPRI